MQAFIAALPLVTIAKQVAQTPLSQEYGGFAFASFRTCKFFLPSGIVYSETSAPPQSALSGNTQMYKCSARLRKLFPLSLIR